LAEVFAFLAVLLTGVILGLIGAGGAILTVPILVYLFGIQAELATAYSLFIVGLTALVGAVLMNRAGLVDFRTVILFAPSSVLGVYLVRYYGLPAIPDLIVIGQFFELTKNTLIMVVFALLMLATSYSMIGGKYDPKPAQQVGVDLRLLLTVFIEGLVVGAITGFVGAGGGFLMVPALVMLVGLRMKVAVGTSLSIVSIKSLLGLGGDIQRGVALDWYFLFGLSVVAILGIFLGMRLARNFSGAKLKPAFGYFVLVMGAFMLVAELYQ